MDHVTRVLVPQLVAALHRSGCNEVLPIEHVYLRRGHQAPVCLTLQPARGHAAGTPWVPGSIHWGPWPSPACGRGVTQGQSTKDRAMTPGRVWAGLLLAVLLMGCARDTGLQAVQATIFAVERQHGLMHQTVEAQGQQVSDRLTEVESAQVAINQAVAQMAATLDQAHLQLQDLQDTVQATQSQVERDARQRAQAAARRLARLETRLQALATQLDAADETVR